MFEDLFKLEMASLFFFGEPLIPKDEEKSPSAISPSQPNTGTRETSAKLYSKPQQPEFESNSGMRNEASKRDAEVFTSLPPLQQNAPLAFSWILQNVTSSDLRATSPARHAITHFAVEAPRPNGYDGDPIRLATPSCFAYLTTAPLKWVFLATVVIIISGIAVVLGLV